MNAPIQIIELAALVDKLAELKALIAPLEKQADIIKDTLKATGLPRIDGTEHTAVISVSTPEVLDRERLRADMGEDVWRSYLKEPKPVFTLKLTGRRTH